ncbi:PTS sugar transporter subunit IIA [Pontibacillus yanchengensis]|uniref:PTS sugar transporter subunit IIA n=1 Tax=Pontibacillus yanchengensis Y32 TaxID=1385514 RepID=A0A0A2T9C7_9BACI|nr:PTS sugar transporter subunit IIA [Pontibacillus yanchengensis]KGP72387.1 PTS sugar transporter subunit IIA [Pontibacillus yanchengensis Y32]
MSSIYIDESLILHNLTPGNKEEVLRSMAQNLHEKGYVKSSFIDAVAEREEQYATGLPTNGPSVAIPHTDKEHVNQKALSLAILNQPVEFGVMGDAELTTSVEIVFMLAMDSEHSQLSILQKLMGIFQNEQELYYFLNEKDNTKLMNRMKELLKGDE